VAGWALKTVEVLSVDEVAGWALKVVEVLGADEVAGWAILEDDIPLQRPKAD